MSKTEQQPISTRMPPVAIEYDYGTKGERRTKHFEDANKAKRFFAAKDRAGKNPTVLKAEADAGGESAAVTNDAKPAQPDTTEAKQPATPGVKRTKTRPFLAGKIIAKHGHEVGVTDAMVAELDQMYGKANKAESQFCLRNAWHAIRGYRDSK
jgi:hypothetical protein